MGEIDSIKGQAEVSKYMFAFVESMAIKCAVELRIADIIHSYNGQQVTLSQIASKIDSSSSPHIDYLYRIMRFLVRRKIFTTSTSQGGDTLYGLTPISRWLLQDTELSLAPMLLFQNNPILMEPWHYFSKCIKEGGIAFKKAHGCELFEMASKDDELNKNLNNGLNSITNCTVREIIKGYKDGFNSITSLVDVGGGTGVAMFEIVKAYPHIKGINFDLPHVVSTAQKYEGIHHVGGDMFEGNIPPADAVFVKCILHDWEDEDCVNILKNCKKAIPAKTGKVIIVDAVLKLEGEGLFDDMKFILDLTMLANTRGKERSEDEWNKLLKEAGFPRYNIINIPIWLSIIEAYPQ